MIIPAGPGAPEFLDDEVIGQHLAGILSKESHDPELTEGELHIFPADQDLVLVVVNHHISHCVGAPLGNLVIAAGGAGVADGRADPG